MVQILSAATASFAPPPIIQVQPGHFTMSDKQISAARFITSEAFLHSLGNPFKSEEYKSIGFPFSLGFLDEEESAKSELQNLEHHLSQTPQSPNVRFEGRILKSPTLRAAKGILVGRRSNSGLLNRFARRIAGDDYVTYQDPKVKLLCTLDVARIKAGYSHRVDHNHVCDEYHVDSDLDKQNVIKKALSDIRERKGRASGISRTYAFASCYPTEFPNAAFAPWELFHFVAEKHRSPVIPIMCDRIFGRITVIPQF